MHAMRSLCDTSMPMILTRCQGLESKNFFVELITEEIGH